MQSQNIIKIAKLVILFIAALSGAYLSSRQAGANETQGQPRRQLELVGIDAPFETRAGTDDGAAFVIRFMGSTHGNLEPCG